MPTVIATSTLVVLLVILAAIGAHRVVAPVPTATAQTSSATEATSDAATTSPTVSPAPPAVVVRAQAQRFGGDAESCDSPDCAEIAVAGDTIRAGFWSSKGGPACHWQRNAGADWETSGDPRAPITIHLGNGARFAAFGCRWQLYFPD